MDILTRSGYRWPGQYTPFDHQKVTSEFLVGNKRAFCFNDIGTGKTLSLLWSADFLMSVGAVKKVVIAAPLSTLWTVWADAIFRNFVNRQYAVLYGPKKKRLENLKKNVDFYIINHEGISVILKEISRRDDISLVIADEGARIRNARTNRWKSMWQFAGPDTGKGLWWATGSPMPRGPEDVWAQARIINPNNVHKYFTRYRDEMMRKINAFKWIPVNGWEEKCFRFLQPSIRFKRDDCIDLPPCTTQKREVLMGKNQTDAYAQMKEKFVAELKTGDITALNEGVKRIKLLQIAAGAVYDGAGQVHFLDPVDKLSALGDTVRESGDKALIFVPFRHSLPFLRKYIEVSLKMTVGVVYGDVSVAARTDIFKRFQHGDLNIILAHPGTMAHGLTLTAAHTVIWWAPCDDYEIYEQANGRITRPGQRNIQTIVHLSCSEIENIIYKRLQNKEKMQGALLELMEHDNS
jgi:SNF2 family DNA or RNA helicase